LKNVAPYVRDEAEPVVRPATDANDARVVAGFPFSGECSIQSPQWERSARRRSSSADETNGCDRCR
jgi:hypothetical protein